MKGLGVFAERGQHTESAFVDGTVSNCSSAKSLLKKIDKHRDSASHQKAENALAMREANKLKDNLRAAQLLFEVRHRDKIEATEKIFRTAYECAKSHLSFTEYSKLVTLQTINGVKCGSMVRIMHAVILFHILLLKCVMKLLITYFLQMLIFPFSLTKAHLCLIVRTWLYIFALSMTVMCVFIFLL